MADRKRRRDGSCGNGPRKDGTGPDPKDGRGQGPRSGKRGGGNRRK